MTAKSRRRKLEKKNKVLINSENPRHFFKHEGRVVEVVAPNLALAKEHFKLEYGYEPTSE